MISRFVSFFAAISLVTPTAATAQLQPAGSKGPGTSNFSPAGILNNTSRNPDKLIVDENTGIEYRVYYLPSGRSLVKNQYGAEFVYDPRNGETILKKKASIEK